MAISKAVRPSVLVFGFVRSIRELKRRADQSVYGAEVLLQQESGAQLAVTFYDPDGSGVLLPGVGEFFAAEASVEESRDYGASLAYVASAANVVDLIQSTLSSRAA